jgi:uncharacterized membrane protein
LALAYFACFVTLSLARYEGYQSRSFDLAIVVRMLWGIRHGSFEEVFTHQPWIAYHFEPILLAVAPIDALLPVARGLLVIQTAALAIAAWPAWRLGRRTLGGDAGGTAAVIATLLYPVLGHTNVFEFHPVALAIAPGLWLLDALDAGHRRSAIAAALLVAACREDGLLFVALALASVPCRDRRQRLARAGAAATCLAIYGLWAFVVVARLGTQGSLRSHFGVLGATPVDVLHTVFTQPRAVVGQIVTRHKLTWLFSLLAPLAFLPLVAPRRSLAGAAAIAINLLSSIPGATRLADSHYAALVAPGLIAGALFGAARIARLLDRVHVPRPRDVVSALLVGAAVFGQAAWGAAPRMGGYAAELYEVGPRADALDELVARVERRPDAGVSAPADVLAHVARRQTIRLFPGDLSGVDLVIADLASRPFKDTSIEQTRALVQARIARAVASGMTILVQRGPLVLLGRNE